MEEQSVKLRVEGFKIQNDIISNIKEFDDQLAEYKIHLATNEKNIDEMQAQIDKEYKEFSIQRKRWKSDFINQKYVLTNTLDQTEALVSDCMKQNEWNSKAVKSLLDAQMIEHLIQR